MSDSKLVICRKHLEGPINLIGFEAQTRFGILVTAIADCMIIYLLFLKVTVFLKCRILEMLDPEVLHSRFS